MKNKLGILIRLLLPYIAIGISILVYYGVSDTGKQKKMDHPYYLYFIGLIGLYILIGIIIGLFK